eukprot:2673074-Pleurochrysis_carterae.AAC.2
MRCLYIQSKNAYPYLRASPVLTFIVSGEIKSRLCTRRSAVPARFAGMPHSPMVVLPPLAGPRAGPRRRGVKRHTRAPSYAIIIAIICAQTVDAVHACGASYSPGFLRTLHTTPSIPACATLPASVFLAASRKACHGHSRPIQARRSCAGRPFTNFRKQHESPLLAISMCEEEGLSAAGRAADPASSVSATRQTPSSPNENDSSFEDTKAAKGSIQKFKNLSVLMLIVQNSLITLLAKSTRTPRAGSMMYIGRCGNPAPKQAHPIQVAAVLASEMVKLPVCMAMLAKDKGSVSQPRALASASFLLQYGMRVDGRSFDPSCAASCSAAAELELTPCAPES